MQLQRRLAGRRIDLELSPEATDWLADNGFDPSYGARPLKRLIQKEIADKLALQLLEGRYEDGSKLRVAVEDDGLGFERL